MRAAVRRRRRAHRPRVPRQHDHGRQPVGPGAGGQRQRRVRRRLGEREPGRQRARHLPAALRRARPALGGETRVNTSIAGDQRAPAVAIDASGAVVARGRRPTATAWASSRSASTPTASRREASSRSTSRAPATQEAPRWRWMRPATSSSSGKGRTPTRKASWRAASIPHGNPLGRRVRRQQRDRGIAAFAHGRDERERSLGRRLAERQWRKYRRDRRPALRRLRQRRRCVSSRSTQRRPKRKPRRAWRSMPTATSPSPGNPRMATDRAVFGQAFAADGTPSGPSSRSIRPRRATGRAVGRHCRRRYLSGRLDR